jgi:hypothetical protein
MTSEFIIVGFTKPNGDRRQALIAADVYLENVKLGYHMRGEFSYYIVPGCSEICEVGRIQVMGDTIVMDDLYFTD